MKTTSKIIKEIIFGHVGACIVLLCIVPVFFTAYGLYRGFEIKVEQISDPSDEEDLIVVGFSQLGSESGWRSAHTASIQQALTKDAGYFLIFNNAFLFTQAFTTYLDVPFFFFPFILTFI